MRLDVVRAIGKVCAVAGTLQQRTEASPGRADEVMAPMSSTRRASQMQMQRPFIMSVRQICFTGMCTVPQDSAQGCQEQWRGQGHCSSAGADCGRHRSQEEVVSPSFFDLYACTIAHGLVRSLTQPVCMSCRTPRKAANAKSDAAEAANGVAVTVEQEAVAAQATMNPCAHLDSIHSSCTCPMCASAVARPGAALTLKVCVDLILLTVTESREASAKWQQRVQQPEKPQLPQTAQPQPIAQHQKRLKRSWRGRPASGSGS